MNLFGRSVALTRILVLTVVCLAALTGCPRLPDPDGCTPVTTRCGPRGDPQVCSQSQRWAPASRPCADLGAVCCRTVSAYGTNERHACVPQGRCLPEPVDEDASAEGGDQ